MYTLPIQLRTHCSIYLLLALPMVAAMLLVAAARLRPLRAVKTTTDCYAHNPNPSYNFVSKTAYNDAYNKKGIAPIPGCKAVQLWLVSRHGTRWPAAEEIPLLTALSTLRDQVIANHKANKGRLCQEDIDNLKAWHFSLPLDKADTLTTQGWRDLYGLGRRIRTFFPELFKNTPPLDKFSFRYTDTSRTRESAEYFARGLLGLDFDQSPPSMPGPIQDEDHLLTAYENCPVWKKKKGLGASLEREKFEASEHFTKMVARVSRRLGFDHDLTHEIIDDIYDGCRYQRAWEVERVSPWCAAFSKEDLDVLEYTEDVKQYYKTGPGHPLNLRMACPLAKDMFDVFSAEEGTPDAKQPLGLFSFTHATMIDLLSTRLGLTVDTPLVADNFAKQTHRQYRTTLIQSFATNLLAVLYKCSGGELKMAFYQSEHRVRYPGCSDGICSWSFIKQKFPFVKEPTCTDRSFCFDNTKP